MDRTRAAHLPLTPQVIASHLVGDAFVGLHPLLRDNGVFLQRRMPGYPALGFKQVENARP